MADLFTLVGSISIEMKDAMQNIESVINKVNELEDLLNGTQSATQTTAQKAGQAVTDATEDATKNTSSTLSKWTVAMGNLATQAWNKVYGYGKDFFQTGFEYNRNMEKWTASLKTYLGNDLVEATKLVADLQQFAIDTPLSMEEVMNQAVQLLATGTAPDKLTETLRVIGDLSKGDMGIFASVSRAYWQVMTTGRLLAQDANQMTQAGIPIWQIMTDYFNKIGRDGNKEWAVKDTRNLATAAFLQKNPALAITSEEVFAALQWATSQEGMYFNAMNNVMETEYGKAQKMMDEYTMSAGAFTQAIFDVFSSDTIPAMAEIFKQLNEWATENPDALRTLAEGFSNFATNGIGALVNGMTTLLDFFSKNEGALEGVMVLLGGLLMTTGHPFAGAAILGTVFPEVWNDYKTGVVDPIMQDPAGAVNAAQGNLENGTTIIHYMTGTGAFSEDRQEYLREPTSYENFMLWFNGMFNPEAKKNMEKAWGLVEEDENEQGGGGFRWGLPEGVSNDGIGGNAGSLAGTLAALQGTLSSLPAQIEAAASNGVATGVSGITVTGTITTGNVMLNTGAIVGELTPRFNLTLGRENSMSARWG